MSDLQHLLKVRAMEVSVSRCIWCWAAVSTKEVEAVKEWPVPKTHREVFAVL
jgi:hypothetical protein